jgi:hypothetical protein
MNNPTELERYRFLNPKAPKFIKGQKVKCTHFTGIFTVHSVQESTSMLGYSYALKDEDNVIRYSQGFMEYDLELIK